MSTMGASRDYQRRGVDTSGVRQPHSRIVRQLWSYASVRPSGSVARRALTTLALVIGSVLLASSGVIHLQLWSSGYRTIPTIGPLFLFQGITGILLAVLLFAWRRLLAVVMAIGFMIATVGGLLFSVFFGLFGFMETLAAPYAGLSLGVESLGALLLAVVAVVFMRGDTVRDKSISSVELGRSCR